MLWWSCGGFWVEALRSCFCCLMWETAKHQRVRPTAQTHSLQMSHGWLRRHRRANMVSVWASFSFWLKESEVKLSLWNKLCGTNSLLRVCKNVRRDSQSQLVLVWMSGIRELMIDYNYPVNLTQFTCHSWLLQHRSNIIFLLMILHREPDSRHQASRAGVLHVSDLTLG